MDKILTIGIVFIIEAIIGFLLVHFINSDIIFLYLILCAFMEEDIKILEDLFYEDESYEPNGYVEIFLHKEQQQAIQNLINRNKELEENLKQEKMWRISLLKENEDICNEVNNNYIRKSKVEEVIKKVNESNGFSTVNKILIEQVLNSILKIGG